MEERGERNALRPSDGHRAKYKNLPCSHILNTTTTQQKCVFLQRAYYVPNTDNCALHIVSRHKTYSLDSPDHIILTTPKMLLASAVTLLLFEASLPTMSGAILDGIAPVIQLDQATLIGVTNELVESYLGIPYAEPP